MKQILLITLGLSAFLWADFTRANNIVTDSTTLLEWQDDEIGSTMNWESAIAQCEALSLDGRSWRLPNINELKTIIDDSKFSPAIVGIFTNTGSSTYWSSTTYDGGTNFAWSVDFLQGRSLNDNDKVNDNRYVRCVAGGS